MNLNRALLDPLSTVKFIVFFVILFAGNSAYAQTPVINSFSPENGPTGTVVVISGNNFSPNASNNIVYFGTVKGNVIASSITELKVAVPVGASAQPITVTANGLTTYSQRPFIATFDVIPFNAGSLNKRVDFTAGGGMEAIAVKDLDGDGKPDIVSTDGSGVIQFLKNNSLPGIPSFSLVLSKTVKDYSVGAFIDDLDGDGKPDVVITDYNARTISIFKNTSTVNNISFDNAIILNTLEGTYNVVIADFNGDGKPDLAVSNENSDPAVVSVFANATIAGGPLKFLTRPDFLTDYESRGISAADIDMDGKPDIVVSCQSGFISILKNTSVNNIINFAPKVDYSIASGLESTVIIDMDGDLKPDIVVADNDDGNITILKNNSTPGSISFSSIQSIAAGGYPYGIAAGDMNGDGKPDIAVTNQLSNLVSVFINTSSQGQISLGPKVSFATSIQPRRVFIGDLDGDGKPDLAVGNVGAGVVSVLLAIPPPVILTGLLTGVITSCIGMASSNPNILQFTVSGSNLKAAIIAKAPTGFEISTSPDNGYASNLTLPQAGGIIANTLLYVRSSATATAGNNSGNITLSTNGGTSKNVIVIATVNALPVVNQVSDQIAFNGMMTDPINFSGTANTYTWANDQPAIGLSANGFGDIGNIYGYKYKQYSNYRYYQSNALIKCRNRRNRLQWCTVQLQNYSKSNSSYNSCQRFNLR